jgi:hypothetical protein
MSWLSPASRPRAGYEHLRARPDVAVTIDTAAQPPYVLQMRGRVTLTDHDGLMPEYAAVQRRYQPADVAEQVIAATDQPGLRMVRVALRPSWVGVLDFRTRFPCALADV